jgi:NDP-sugar pyrophosphorylase family protein
MKAVILSGSGNQIKPFTEVIPKPLLPVGEKAVMEIQIEHLKSTGHGSLFGYELQIILYRKLLGDGSKYGVKLMISKEEKLWVPSDRSSFWKIIWMNRSSL